MCWASLGAFLGPLCSPCCLVTGLPRAPQSSSELPQSPCPFSVIENFPSSWILLSSLQSVPSPQGHSLWPGGKLGYQPPGRWTGGGQQTLSLPFCELCYTEIANLRGVEGFQIQMSIVMGDPVVTGAMTLEGQVEVMCGKLPGGGGTGAGRGAPADREVGSRRTQSGGLWMTQWHRLERGHLDRKGTGPGGAGGLVMCARWTEAQLSLSWTWGP